MMILIEKIGINDAIYHAETLNTLIQQIYWAVTLHSDKAVLNGEFITIR